MSATDAISNERLDALLRGDRPRTSGEERRAALLDGIRSARLQAPDALRSRVLATKPVRSRVPRFALPTRRLVFVVVPAAAMLAVGAALVHGLVGSSGKTGQSLAVESQVQQKTWGAANAGGAATGSYRALAPTATPGRLQHTAASLVVRVPDVDTLSQATSAATKIATSLGGYAQSVVYSTPQLDSGSGGGSSAIELRIPAQNVKTALARLAALGTIVSQQVSVQDLQHAFTVQTAQIAQLRRSVAALQLALRDPALPDAQRVLLKIRLAEQQRALAQRLHARTGTVAAGTTARVSLVLNTADAVAPVPTHHGRLGRMVHSAIGFLALEATVALYVLIVIGPFALLAALAWGLNRARRRRDERRLLAT